MKLTSVSNQYVSTDNRPLWEFTQNLNPGDINCIIGNKEKKVMETFYKLTKTFSKEKSVGYMVSKKQYGRQNLYLRYDNISQSKPLNSIEEIEHEIRRMVNHYEKPIIFIKNFFKITIGSNNWQNSMNTKFKEATEKLKKVAKKYKVTIYTYMLFDSEEILKKYFLLYENRGIGLVFNKTEEFYFNKQFCLYRSKDYTYKARKKLKRQLLLANPGLRNIEKWIIVSSIVGIGDVLWFSFPFPYIFLNSPFIYDKRIIPQEFKGYHIQHSICKPYKRYFPNEKSLNAEEKYSPKNLTNFVENHLELILWKLNKPNLTKREALDALTGGFELHVQECEKLKKERLINSTKK